jgi:hypothetical protein
MSAIHSSWLALLYRDWQNITHVFIEQDVKEQAKEIFGFSALPFTVVFGKEGNILASGDPKTLSLKSIVSEDSKPKASGGLAFDEDFWAWYIIYFRKYTASRSLLSHCMYN